MLRKKDYKAVLAIWSQFCVYGKEYACGVEATNTHREKDWKYAQEMLTMAISSYTVAMICVSFCTLLYCSHFIL